MPSHDGHPVVRETYNIPDCMYNSKLLIAVLALSIAGLFHVEGFTFNLSRLGSAKRDTKGRSKDLKASREPAEPLTKQRHQSNYSEPHSSRRSPKTQPEKYEFPPVQQLPEQKSLPDPFLMYGGSRVKTMEDWHKQRHYLKEMLAHYLYGHMPSRPKQIQVDGVSASKVFDGKAVEEHQKLTITRNSRSLSFRMALIRPTRKGRRPVIVKNCFTLFDPNALPEGHMGRKTAERDRNAARMAVKHGYILCKFIRTDVAADGKDNRSAGVFPLYPEYDWGTIAAWAWAHQLVIDTLDRLGHADMGKIVATGHSRGGKTALCAGIFDERIAVTAPNSSGTGGTGSMRYFERGQRPQTVDYLKGAFPYWWVPRFADFAKQPDKLPFDSHFMKALIAPRGLVNPHARQDYWANPYGTELTYRAAQVVFDWLGVSEHQGIHWRQGGHAQNEEDWRALLDFADKYFFSKKIEQKFDVLAYPEVEVPMTWKSPEPIHDPFDSGN